MIGRRQFLGGCAYLATAALLPRVSWSCGSRDLNGRIDRALESGVQYFAGRQAGDGAWRSEIYGPFKDGPSLTSLIAATLGLLPDVPSATQGSERAVQYLAGLVHADGSIQSNQGPLTFPVYTAAGALLAMSRLNPCNADVRDAWLNYLRERQLTEELGWEPSDEAFGGWSYAPDRPRPINGRPPTPLAAPNLSATTFALEALTAAGCSSDDPAMQKALAFVKRCQNWCDAGKLPDLQFDDGGFYFIVEDPQRNKAGEDGIDAQGRTRYASYGSATADGLRALMLCGLPTDHRRVVAARRWLEGNFSANSHPGFYAISRSHVKEAVFYYYCASASKAFMAIKHRANWAADMATVLVDRQQENGSWANPVVEIREDDPLVATSFALQSLFFCEQSLSNR